VEFKWDERERRIEEMRRRGGGIALCAAGTGVSDQIRHGEDERHEKMGVEEEDVGWALARREGDGRV
jgi:hypothetical protein